MSEAWRFLAVLDVAVIFGCGAFLHMRHSGDVPRVLRLAAEGAAALLALVALGVVANALGPVPPTLGVKIFAAGAAVVALLFAWLTVQSERHPDRYLSR